MEQNVRTLEYLNMWGVKVEEDCIERLEPWNIAKKLTLFRLTRLLLKFKPWEITITNSDSAFQALMNERFFEMYFLGNNWPKGCAIDFGFEDYYREVYLKILYVIDNDSHTKTSEMSILSIETSCAGVSLQL